MLYMICPPFVLRKRLLRDSLRTMVSVDLAAACAWHMAHGSQEERGEKINGFGHCTNIACFGLTLYYIFNLDPLPDL